MWFPKDDLAEWLNKIDVAVPLEILHYFEENSSGAAGVLEVGVWKGGWAAAILMNSPHASVVGVDPYPNLAHVKNSMLKRIEALGLGKRFSLRDDMSMIESGAKFDLIHVDDEHSEEATLRDLSEADKVLADSGVIMVDDINHLWFPGVSSATHLFMIERNYRMFLTTGSKAYLARSDFASSLYNALRDRGGLGPLSLHQEHQDAYRQETKVLGQPVLIATYKQSLGDLYRKAKPRLVGLLRRT